MLKNPNQIIAALLDIADAAHTMLHNTCGRWPAPPVTEMQVASDDLAALEKALAELKALPGEGDSISLARLALATFTTGVQDSPAVLEASCWICADTGIAFGKVCDCRKPKVEAVMATSDHDLYSDADADRPDTICDRNGQVVLGLCKACGKAEAELVEPCEPKEKCAFCGATVADPCDEPPSDICEKAINATYGSPLTPKNPVEQKAVSNPPTCDDALNALNHYEEKLVGYRHDGLAVVRAFINRLIAMGNAETIIGSDERGYVIEGAYQYGFDNIDDNADLLVVHCNDLIRYVLAQREAATPEYLARKDRKIMALTSVCTTEQIAQAMREFERMNSDKAVVIDLDHVAMKQIRDTYIEVFGPLDPNITGNDIDWHVCEIIKSKAEPHKYAPNTIIVIATDDDGKPVVRGVRSTHSPQLDYSIMEGALEFEQAMRLRGVEIKPHQLGKLWVTTDSPLPYQAREIGEGDWRDVTLEAYSAARDAPEMDTRIAPDFIKKRPWIRSVVFDEMRARLAMPHDDDGAEAARHILKGLNNIAYGNGPETGPLHDAAINDITIQKLGNWTSFESQSWACKVVRAVLEKQMIYPAEMNMHLRAILGTMCFHVIKYMPLYRKSGFEIPQKAEDEQAFMIDRLLRAYLVHGDKWEAAVNTEMRELHAKLQHGERAEGEGSCSAK